VKEVAPKKKMGRPRNFRTKVCFTVSPAALAMLLEMDEQRGGNARGMIVEEAIRLKYKMDRAFENVAKHPLAGLLMQVATANADGQTALPAPGINSADVQAQIEDLLK